MRLVVIYEIVLCMFVVLVVEIGVVNCLYYFNSMLIHILLNFTTNRLKLNFDLKLLKNFRELLDIVFVVHFSVNFKYDELINR